MFLQEAERSGQLVARLENVTHTFGGDPVIRNFSTTVFRGDKHRHRRPERRWQIDAAADSAGSA
jgi:ATPase subunit of ABC transporter with duplicated ATPase domains